ncbi:hypothetical protein ACIRO1_45300 [Streptomyces sp. NPDC102381]|uniref:hypothetical protein n=1 Tax=Streptomyces sp. NPDC102381 TaxID=3366164 RepID=UPI00382C6D4D
MPTNFTSTLATYLFVSQAPATEFATNPDRTRELILDTATRLSPQRATDEFAAEYGRHPETAAAHMQACLQAVALTDIQIPLPVQRTAVSR